MICKHCNKEHIYVCNCGHPHSEHNFAGGCIHKENGVMCYCDGYDQTKQRKEGK